jgi:hypothetical protein
VSTIYLGNQKAKVYLFFSIFGAFLTLCELASYIILFYHIWNQVTKARTRPVHRGSFQGDLGFDVVIKKYFRLKNG